VKFIKERNEMERLNQEFDIDLFLPDSLVQDDLQKILWTDGDECKIELETDDIVIPKDTKLEVVDKIYRKNIYDVSFGNYFYTHVAIGGVKKVSGGIIIPVYCFATLFYTSSRKMITVDFHSDMR
jgi:hypothetical protein